MNLGVDTIQFVTRLIKRERFENMSLFGHNQVYMYNKCFYKYFIFYFIVMCNVCIHVKFMWNYKFTQIYEIDIRSEN